MDKNDNRHSITKTTAFGGHNMHNRQNLGLINLYKYLLLVIVDQPDKQTKEGKLQLKPLHIGKIRT